VVSPDRRAVLTLGLLPLWPAAAGAQSSAQAAPAADGRFSAGKPGGQLPAGWQRVPLNDKKTPTDYALVADDGRTVLRAQARSAASLVARRSSVALDRTPVVRWRWKLGALPTGADNAVAAKEDAAARLIFAFDGDREKLPLADRTVMKVAKSMSGRDMPYATLMYVTSAVAPVGTRIPNPHTRRVQMVVASTEQDALGRWLALERDLAADFRAAFDEPPGRVVAFGVMSDSDNTQTEVEAWYGDIGFEPKA
jgi:hypothetical protein